MLRDVASARGRKGPEKEMTFCELLTAIFFIVGFSALFLFVFVILAWAFDHMKN